MSKDTPIPDWAKEWFLESAVNNPVPLSTFDEIPLSHITMNKLKDIMGEFTEDNLKAFAYLPQEQVMHEFETRSLALSYQRGLLINAGRYLLRLFGDEIPLFYPKDSQKVKANITWTPESSLLTYTPPDQPEDPLHISIPKSFIASMQQWVKIFRKKTALYIDGAVNSGKTFTSKILLPFFIHQFWKGGDFCHVYIDLSVLANAPTLEEKWAGLERCFAEALAPFWFGENIDLEFKIIESLKLLPTYLKSGIIVEPGSENIPAQQSIPWFIVLDNYYCLFTGLKAGGTHGLSVVDSRDTLSNKVKSILFREELPCYFILSGGNQATFWVTIDLAHTGGINMKSRGIPFTLPSTSTPEELNKFVEILVQKEGATVELCKEVLSLLHVKNTVNLSQIVRRVKADPSGAITPLVAYNEFLANQYAVYWEQYSMFPESFSPRLLTLPRVDGTELGPPYLFEQFVEKRGRMYFLIDRYFEFFFKISFDPTVTDPTVTDPTKVEFSDLRDKKKDEISWVDIILFIPLLKIATGPNITRTIDKQFEHAAEKFSSLFDRNNFNSFIGYLTSHPANTDIHAVPPADFEITWVTIIYLLRNIATYENRTNWHGISECTKQVLLYTKTRANFQALLDIEEVFERDQTKQ